MQTSDGEEKCLLTKSTVSIKKYGSEPFLQNTREQHKTQRCRSRSWSETNSARLWFVGSKPEELVTISNYPLQEAYIAKKVISETLLGRRTFHISWALGIVLVTVLGAVSLCILDKIPFIDAWFLCTSAFTNAGLSTVPMTEISSVGFNILWIMMLVGSTTFMTVPTMLWRRNRLGRTLRRMDDVLKHSGVSYVDVINTDTTPFDNSDPIECVKHHRQMYDALLVAVGLVLSYMIAVCSVGMCLMYISLSAYAEEPELRDRGFSRVCNSLFLGLSAYTNTGATLSTANMMWYADKPAVLVVMGILILLGNVLFPYMMYSWIEAVAIINRSFVHSGQLHLQSSLMFIKRNPRVVCTYFFCYEDVMYLLHISVFCIMLEWAVFVGICVYKEQRSLHTYGEGVNLAMMGLFQTLNSRHAGFTIFNVRDLPDALLLVTAVMMFTSPVPYINILHTTTVRTEDPGHIPRPDESHPALLKVLERVFFRVWFLRCSVLFFLALTEDHYLETNRESINLWMLTFEIISAFGLVGLSFGVPNKLTSLAGAFTVYGKLLMILTCYFGKNRGLPKTCDQVIDFRFAKLKNILHDMEECCQKPE